MSTSTEHEDLGIVLAMVFMSWSDQSLNEQEVQLINEEARNQGLDEKELNLLNQAMHQPPSLETIVSYLPTLESRKAAAVAAYISALADRTLTLEELKTFDQMCEVFGLSELERDEIRAFGDREIPLTKTGDWKEALFLENIEFDE
ncbi:MAG: DUF533 domain-containing protein [Ardenticatenaceae bacterium]|nr:DUF533 domain-containing protein [Ardenticatenaceae bacterium]